MTPTSSLGLRDAAAFALEPQTLGEALSRAARDFSHLGISLLDRRGRQAERRTYERFFESVELAARRFATLGLDRQDRVVVCLPTSWLFLETWFGVHLAGGLPVAMAPPGGMGSAALHLQRVLDVAQSLDARYLVCLESFVDHAPLEGRAGWRTTLLTPERFQATAVGPRPSPRTDPDEVAFLQLTSGSTGIPRAVQIPHRAAIHNAVASSEAIGRPQGGLCQEWADSMVSWLPLYHDMGLVGALLLSLVNGIELRLISPRSFLGRPHVWLEALARAGRSFSPAPNFAYQLAVERSRPERLEGLDLSRWVAAMTGSEMVRPETVNSFCETFAHFGFAPEAIRPCYGMAESTLAVAVDCRGEGIRTHPLPADADAGLGLQEVVCVGGPVIDTELEICAPDGRPLPAETIGEVRVKGPGVFAGYWQDDAATAEVLRDGWLYTGDLGFVDRAGELFLTGRRKEILILHGQNVMPHELEWIAEGVSGGGGTLRSAAFSVAHGGAGEQAVLVLETERDERDVLRRLRHDVASAIGRNLQIPLADVVLVRRGTIPKTSSGKVQRRTLRARYLRGELERLESEQT